MTEAIPDEEDLLHQHSINFDDLLKDCDFPGESPLHVGGGFIGNSSNIWSAGCSSPISNDFLSYGLSNGYHGDVGSTNQWSSLYGNGGHGFKSGSPVRDESFTQLSQAESDGSDHSWYGMNGRDFGKATAEGAQKLAEALVTQWNGINGCSNGIYDPFNSSSVIDDLNGVPIHIPSREKSPLRRSQSANSRRPTFADVAKKPSSPGSEPPPTPSLSSDGPVYESHESLSSLIEKLKPKAFRPAHPRHGGYHVPLPINPDSKYGLDDFEVQEVGVKMERSLSCNDALDRSSQAVSSSGGGAHESEDESENESGVGMDSDVASGESGQEWFDPKRIFQNGTPRSRSESVPCATVLNNNLSARAQGTKSNGRRNNTSYINNLHDGSHRAAKQTNTDRAKPSMNGHATTGLGPQLTEVDAESNQPTSNGSVHTAAAAATVSSGVSAGHYMSGGVRLAKYWTAELLKFLLLAVMLLIQLTSQVVYFVAHHTCFIVTRTFTYLAVKVGLNSGAPNEQDFNSFTKNAEQLIAVGLDENIKLPETCDEAMRRLLTCQGKDAYSILGIRSDASDEEVKRYYRRQAVLVHPDKNQQPGAEEAFKILGQAVELIGTPEKRTVYDRKIQEEKISEDVMRQFGDLLTQFQEKIAETANWMQCNHCGGKHRRYPTDKPVYSARKCNRCQCHHAAKEGEIWAETTFMGFKWHFYACMENRIYDVTPWISCQPDMVDKFQPNSHTVRLKMSSSSNGNSTSPSSREADWENLLKNMSSSGSEKLPTRPAPGEGSRVKTNGASCNRKGKRRARRR